MIASHGISGGLAGGWLANDLDTSNQLRIVPQTNLLNLANNRVEIAILVISLGAVSGWVKVEIKDISAQPTELELD